MAKLAADHAMKRADEAMERAKIAEKFAQEAAMSAARARGQLEGLTERVRELEATCGAGARGGRARRAKKANGPKSRTSARRKAIRLDP